MAESITIELDANSRAFYAGVAAGAEASDQLAELPAGTPQVQQAAYFWLKVGTVLAQRVPDANDELVALFVRGAALRAPEGR